MMNVYGIKITKEQIHAGLLAIRGEFASNDIERALADAGVPRSIKNTYAPYIDNQVLHRAADRLLQRERKKGRIAFAGGVWTEVYK